MHRCSTCPNLLDFISHPSRLGCASFSRSSSPLTSGTHHDLTKMQRNSKNDQPFATDRPPGSLFFLGPFDLLGSNLPDVFCWTIMASVRLTEISDCNAIILRRKPSPCRIIRMNKKGIPRENDEEFCCVCAAKWVKVRCYELLRI